MNIALMVLIFVSILAAGTIAGVALRRPRRPGRRKAGGVEVGPGTAVSPGEAVRSAAPDRARTGGRIVVGVSGSLGSLAALRRGCELARTYRKPVLAVLAWSPPGGELAYRQAPCPPLSTMWQHQATLRLLNAFDSALGGFPPDLCVEPLVLRAPAAEALTATADRQDDILVVGAGDRRPVRRLLRGAVRRRVLAHAACPVLAVRPPATPRGALRALRHADPGDFRPGGPDGEGFRLA